MDDFLVRNNIKQYRIALGWPQWKLALVAGIAESRISILEQGGPPRATERGKLTRALIEQRVMMAGVDASFLMRTLKNYRDPAFVEMVKVTGATYDHVQKDEALKEKARAGGSSEAAMAAADKLMQGIADAFEFCGIDPRNTKEDAFNDNLGAEEPLPL